MAKHNKYNVRTEQAIRIEIEWANAYGRYAENYSDEYWLF